MREKKWDEAFATARQTHRKVWVRVCERYCGPCFMLTRWLDDHKEMLERDYVLLKIDDWGDLHGKEVAKRLGGEPGRHSVPCHLRFQCTIADQQRLGRWQYRLPVRLRREEAPTTNACGNAQRR